MVESYKSGFEPPGDVEFEDYGPGQSMKRTVSETSLSNSRGEAKERPSGGKSKGKLWPFIKNKNKVTYTPTYSKVLFIAIPHRVKCIICGVVVTSLHSPCTRMANVFWPHCWL